jgi:hypothetical protein
MRRKQGRYDTKYENENSRGHEAYGFKEVQRQPGSASPWLLHSELADGGILST